MEDLEACTAQAAGTPLADDARALAEDAAARMNAAEPGRTHAATLLGVIHAALANAGPGADATALDEDFVAHAIARLDIPAILAFSGTLQQLHYADCVLVAGFEMARPTGLIVQMGDGSFLFFVEEGTLQPEDLDNPEYDGFESLVAADDAEFAIRAASRGFVGAHGEPAAWLEGARDSDREDFVMVSVSEEVADSLDPRVDTSDLGDEQGWDSDDVPAVEEALLDAWLGLGIDEVLPVCIESGVEVVTGYDGEDRSAFVEIHHYDPSIDTRAIEERLTRILEILVGLDGFYGHSWEYNDGAHDRLSGYSQCSVTIVDGEIDRSTFSNHVLLEARSKLVRRLVEAGTDEREAERLATLQWREPAR